MIPLTQKEFIKPLLAQTSLDENVLSPLKGVSIRLSNSENPDVWFVGTIMNPLTATIRNYDTGVYTGMNIQGQNTQ